MSRGNAEAYRLKIVRGWELMEFKIYDGRNGDLRSRMLPMFSAKEQAQNFFQNFSWLYHLDSWY